MARICYDLRCVVSYFNLCILGGHVRLCECVWVFVPVCTAFHLAFNQMNLYRLQNSATPLTIGFHLLLLLPKTLLACILFLCTLMIANGRHTYIPQSRFESFKTYNFNLIWPKKGKSGNRISNETPTAHTKYSMNFSLNHNKKNIKYYICFAPTHTSTHTHARKYTRTCIQQAHIHTRAHYCSVYSEVRASDERMFCQRDTPSEQKEKNANRIHRRLELHNTHVLNRSGVSALLLCACARFIRSNGQMNPNSTCLLLLLLLLLLLRVFSSSFIQCEFFVLFFFAFAMKRVYAAYRLLLNGLYEIRINIQVDCSKQHWCQPSGLLPILESDF